jgi:hypothetical protein
MQVLAGAGKSELHQLFNIAGRTWLQLSGAKLG